MRNVLIVTRNFAPTSHVSVERALKLAKYLPEFGWRPTILTGARASVGLPEDPALLAQVPHVEVIRARAPELSLFYGGAGNRATGGSGRPARRCRVALLAAAACTRRRGWYRTRRCCGTRSPFARRSGAPPWPGGTPSSPRRFRRPPS